MIGQTVSRYKIVEKLGGRGMDRDVGACALVVVGEEVVQAKELTL
jgi:hypothetical protein